MGYNPAELALQRAENVKLAKKKRKRSCIVSHDWITSLSRINADLDFFGRLHEELCALVLWLDPTPEELLLRQRVHANRSDY